ncbi:hypothetical protein BpHYR1_028141 [Brachionus plicatilis]|uniref:Uncharacterized protein n=1 Tax=Brachionus plicatilis TaxID=10195 RepID=A0A3M7PNG2_BRAPC|nr:hypothetical protein BpHYR1_028141 [Brachionus plicatilis]
MLNQIQLILEEATKNLDRCKVMEFSRSGKSHFAESELLMGDFGSRSALAFVEIEKDLGATFSSNLKFTYHIRTQANRSTIGRTPKSTAAHSLSPSRSEESGGTRGDCPIRPQPNVSRGLILLRAGFSISGMPCTLQSNSVNQFKNRYDAFMTSHQVFTTQQF